MKYIALVSDVNKEDLVKILGKGTEELANTMIEEQDMVITSGTGCEFTYKDIVNAIAVLAQEGTPFLEDLDEETVGMIWEVLRGEH